MNTINSNLENLIQKIDNIALNILLPLRAEKVIDSKIMNEFHSLLDELDNALKLEQTVPKKIVGIVWFVFTAMLAEAEHAKEERDSIEIAAWKIADKLQHIFGPHFDVY